MKNNKLNQPTPQLEPRPAATRERRKLLMVIGGGGMAAAVLPGKWSKPIIDAVVLPAHAQTSMCVADTLAGGPLTGHPSGATTCQAACESEAAAQGAQLCSVTETVDATGTQCQCNLDKP